jgi:hypothetical protein
MGGVLLFFLRKRKKKIGRSNEGIIEIDSLKNSMNNKRTYFNWEHLNNL